MKRERIKINNIPAIVWGEKSDKVYLFVHGKMSSKEAAERFAGIADQKGYQTLSFDLPQHGERVHETARCDIWNGIHDLKVIGDYVFANWKEVSLYGCSLGAFFSLHAYADRDIQKALFQSPILDMEYTVGQMMLWFDITPERLEREKEIDTPVDLLSWDYYQYIKARPIQKWNAPTAILFGGKDNLQSLEVVNGFAEKFNCTLTVSENSEHPFAGDGDRVIVNRWLQENI